jgi:hypothetical protein
MLSATLFLASPSWRSIFSPERSQNLGGLELARPASRRIFHAALS